MSDLKVMAVQPPFPLNSIGLNRGTRIRCIHQDVQDQLGIPVGASIPLGFDGEYICCGPYTWDLEQLTSEISQHKFWEIVETVDLSDPTLNKKFAREIEGIDLQPVH